MNTLTHWITGVLLLSSTAFAQQDNLPVSNTKSPIMDRSSDIYTMDTFYNSYGSWGQEFADQWALKHLQLSPSASDSELKPVTVAVIDTGLDFLHPDMDLRNIWRNSAEIQNGKDDDGNGYIDDLIGWNFVDSNNNPWDYSGHGTHIAGVIAANTGNGEGIAGINPAARIMNLKAANFAGNARGSSVAAAIYYAADMGARIINLSLAGFNISKVEQEALRYAHNKGLLVIAAAGNRATTTGDFGYGSIPEILTVVASDRYNKRTLFSNYGVNAQLAAPGVDILSLRSRNTDFILLTQPENYRAGDAFVGQDRAYYRASGTSFATAIVTAVASRLLSINPQLTAPQLRNKLVQSATDLGVPGVDQLTGYGLINPNAAIAWHPDEYIEARIRSAEVAFSTEEKVVVRITGDASASRFKGARLEIAPAGDNPQWLPLSGPLTEAVRDGVLHDAELEKVINLTPGNFQWIIRLIAEDTNGRSREARFAMSLPDPRRESSMASKGGSR